ncbi:MAG: tRNA guanosine(34) transglycosylase Tgt [Anaerolineae bacterium]|nr:tRNA guanosine(34) transglycosylase Tgt [Anaerolineae bacterium]
MNGYSHTLRLPHGTLSLPAFLPDATLGVVRSLDSADLEACGVQAIVMNTFHLMQRPGSSTVQALGGLHRMAGWKGPIVTDSGGFQAYSLIRQQPRLGRLSDRGITFQPEGAGRRFVLTPEKTVQLQLAYGADVVICLDDCTHADAPLQVQEESVRRTLDWARRGKAEFERILARKPPPADQRPLLFAVIQGGGSRELRRRCAEELLALGFDGYGYGGWPLDERGELLTDIIAYTRELVPAAYPLHGLGIGHPRYVALCAAMGYALFDSALPTRDARQGRLYVLDLQRGPSSAEDWHSVVYVHDRKHVKADRPVDPACDCLCCRRYSLGFLHHLSRVGDPSYLRLATIHNLRAMVRLTAKLGVGSHG